MTVFGFAGQNIRGMKAPQFPEGLLWFNSPPLTLEKLQKQGQVVLIDFWTYSCINCQRTLPYLKEWWQKYQDKGFVLIGVHAPEFEFEKDPHNIAQALEKYGVIWPVVLDKNYQIWNLYDNHYWPSEYLINPQGIIIYAHVGEGNYQQTELKIQEALSLEEAGIPLIGEVSTEVFQMGQTPELYCGYLKGALGNMEAYQKDKNHHYKTKTPEENLEPDLIYLEGVWKAKAEYLEHPRKTEKLEDTIILPYKAKKVYLVMESTSDKSIKVYVTLDAVSLTDESAGSDIKLEEEGPYAKSFIDVSFSTLYNLVNTATFGDHILRISTKEPGLRAFAFTFGN
ncbi:MAG: cytochrome C biogenesis protein [Candidatus Daviesbacteria bacterium GW2011_GWA1_41_61]|uniref:Cytochrome C biogenesis protein n=1 Tax=Candidatus Daviesbacteria bacterium GW2011_GWA2_40_9 TaxID=1618424 RepID=A0A0G0U5K7_9BACT|nr:MAG: cytochrome C biogenesis protein [Candidatus Daviesbacteria bacterium GW2011_GWC1_40_9]KKR82466.1 MAG: cytochrome C biogenesis protein [Candidatus Daviesbacteria bacterium GW2011_GWA2_40_9]KKR93175.1 MAG: cytochrome C biogenesis protein [Candidatus Daviesbacteria bacterium GW2011_GWB1_41_15]KKS15719.1 MAG: cytochrome C biogenesis protein [Candidatus Daviesbacteria bacterium GW2011_GWA1_41_61]